MATGEAGDADPVSRLRLEYDGTDFSGWARQPGERTVQGELERALATVLRVPPPALTVAGRTDAGVHALGQVASYAGPPASVRGLNALLPDDVAVLACEPAPPGFSARHDATSRAYRYVLLPRRGRSPFLARTTLHWPRRLDRDALAACAAALVGERDFTAFTPTRTDHVRFRRVVRHAAWREGEGLLLFEIEADAFMRSMVRVLVGTMLEVGAGRRPPEGFVRLLDGAPRSAAGATAPAHALTLLGVGYGDAPVLGRLAGAEGVGGVAGATPSRPRGA